MVKNISKHIGTIERMNITTLVDLSTDETIYGLINDYSFIGTELYCVENGLNLGKDDYLATGTCTCIADATAASDEVTGVESCGCDTDFSMTTTDGVKACEKSKFVSH